jgi:hypothetical protein
LDAAYASHPEQFVAARPKPHELPMDVWINQPEGKLKKADLSAGTAASEREPGAQDGSRAQEASLDPDERLATLERALVLPDESSILFPELESALCQSG